MAALLTFEWATPTRSSNTSPNAQIWVSKLPRRISTKAALTSRLYIKNPNQLLPPSTQRHGAKRRARFGKKTQSKLCELAVRAVKKGNDSLRPGRGQGRRRKAVEQIIHPHAKNGQVPELVPLLRKRRYAGHEQTVMESPHKSGRIRPIGPATGVK